MKNQSSSRNSAIAGMMIVCAGLPMSLVSAAESPVVATHQIVEVSPGENTLKLTVTNTSSTGLTSVTLIPIEGLPIVEPDPNKMIIGDIALGASLATQWNLLGFVANPSGQLIYHGEADSDDGTHTVFTLQSTVEVLP